MILINGRTHNLGDGFSVTRLLPDIKRRSIGPFIFFDYFGPVYFAPGKGIDVRPHPHIGLATVTYLFEGSQMHRDSIGSLQEVLPGDVNWMTAGRGIAHSERTGKEARSQGHRLHGIQTWIGLPTADEETEPHFQHFPAADLPEAEWQNARIRMIAGSGFGLTSPVKTFSPIFYADAQLENGGSFHYGTEHEERALFIVEGEVQVCGDAHGVQQYGAGKMVYLEKGDETSLFAIGSTRLMLFGGAALDGPRHIWWNFASSSKDRIEQAKLDWKEGRFGTIPGDDFEFIPLPEEKK